MSMASHSNDAKIALKMQHVTIRFGGVIAVRDVSMSIKEGSIVGLIGPNGAGKTTAFNIMTGFYHPSEGDVYFNGKKITNVPHLRPWIKRGLPPHKVCAAGLARTFQNIRLFTNETALQNVMIGCHVRRKTPWWMVPLYFPAAAREEKAIEKKALQLLEKLDLLEYTHELASSLPYGAQRRLEIARALATEPSFLLLDEPAAGMNPQESIELQKLIIHIREEFNLTILLIEHDMKFVMGICKYIWVLEYGSLIAEGVPEDIQGNPDVIRAYLGEEYLKNA